MTNDPKRTSSHEKPQGVHLPNIRVVCGCWCVCGGGGGGADETDVNDKSLSICHHACIELRWQNTWESDSRRPRHSFVLLNHCSLLSHPPLECQNSRIFPTRNTESEST